MKSFQGSRWRTIIVIDDTNQDICAYELDEYEKLKSKMKRQKKRSLIHPKNPVFEKENASPSIDKGKFEYINQVIFSYNEDIQKKINEKVTVEPPKPKKIRLPSLAGIDSYPCNSGKIRMITDIILACNTDLKK